MRQTLISVAEAYDGWQTYKVIPKLHIPPSPTFTTIIYEGAYFP